MKLVLQTQSGVRAWNCEWDTLSSAKRFAPPWMIGDGSYALLSNDGTLIEAEPSYNLEFATANPYLLLTAECLLSYANGGHLSCPQ